ncbi:hypothetical protein IAD21_04079 [Abditibacteriota bacterium]|nr:hypothetical protein IAD21_04079 [Abditibacteriota bacterium]
MYSALRLEAAPASLDIQLLRATEKGDGKTLQSLVKQGANVNARNGDGMTPLMVAAQHSDGALCDFLLKSGADVRAHDKSGFSCLGYGPMFADQFLKHGATATRNDGAALSDWLENDVWIDSDLQDDDVRTDAKMLLRAGMNLNTRGFDEGGTTPLLNAVDSRPSLVAFLLALGADPNLSDATGRTPLMASISALFPATPDDSVALALLARGAKVNPRDEYGETALIMAAHANRLPLTRELLKRGANLNIRNKRGETALMRAAIGGFPDMARLLLASGARTDLKDNKGQTALDMARSREFVFVYGGITGTRKEKAETAVARALNGRLEIQAILEGKRK